MLNFFLYRMRQKALKNAPECTRSPLRWRNKKNKLKKEVIKTTLYCIKNVHAETHRECRNCGVNYPKGAVTHSACNFQNAHVEAHFRWHLFEWHLKTRCGPAATIAWSLSPKRSSWTFFGQRASGDAVCRDCSTIYCAAKNPPGF